MANPASETVGCAGSTLMGAAGREPAVVRCKTSTKFAGIETNKASPKPIHCRRPIRWKSERCFHITPRKTPV